MNPSILSIEWEINCLLVVFVVINDDDVDDEDDERNDIFDKNFGDIEVEKLRGDDIESGCEMFGFK